MTHILTDRQREVLTDVQHAGFEVNEWFIPMQIGGASKTHHSIVLTQLERWGLIESRQRSNLGMVASRGSKVYRLTDAGRAWRAP